jgi:hypothetical protein
VRAGSPAIVPDAFYTPPTDLPATPGRLLRSQPLATGLPQGAQAWRILYTTTMADGVWRRSGSLAFCSRACMRPPARRAS